MNLTQRIIYIWRLIAKVFVYAIYGICSSLYMILFPVIFTLSGFSKKRFRNIARTINFYFFQFFVFLMKLLGILTVNIKNKNRLKEIHSCVVVANHPSFLDVLILFSLIPKANCIVKGTLSKTPFVNAIGNLFFIPNTLPFETQLQDAKIGMDAGETLIIFPEGTRTIPKEPLHFKKGAARFALFADKNIQPIYIGGNEKIGIRKHDKFFSFHPTSRYHYNLEILDPITLEKFKAHPEPSAISLLTNEMQKILEACRENDSELKSDFSI